MAQCYAGLFFENLIHVPSMAKRMFVLGAWSCELGAITNQLGCARTSFAAPVYAGQTMVPWTIPLAARGWGYDSAGVQTGHIPDRIDRGDS